MHPIDNMFLTYFQSFSTIFCNMLNRRIISNIHYVKINFEINTAKPIKIHVQPSLTERRGSLEELLHYVQFFFQLEHQTFNRLNKTWSKVHLFSKHQRHCTKTSTFQAYNTYPEETCNSYCLSNPDTLFTGSQKQYRPVLNFKQLKCYDLNLCILCF